MTARKVGTKAKISTMGLKLLSLIATACSVFYVSSAAAQESRGRDFWVTFPASAIRQPALSVLVTGETATSGTIEIPGQPIQNFVVTPGTVTSIPMPLPLTAYLYRTVGESSVASNDVVENKGVHITAGAPVTVYGLNIAAFESDSYLALPTSTLGKDYIVLDYPHGPSSGGSLFAIVASENATTVTIVPSKDVQTAAGVTIRPALVSYTLELNRGQTYQLINRAAGGDLSGTTITSDKPIAVYTPAGQFLRPRHRATTADSDVGNEFPDYAARDARCGCVSLCCF
jgi:hypothetical protein